MGKGQRNRDLRNGKNNVLINELEEQMAKIDRQFQDQIRKNTKALTDSYKKFNEYVESSFSRTLNSFSQGLNTGSQIRSTVQATTNGHINKQTLLVDAMTVKNATFEKVVIQSQFDSSGNKISSKSEQKTREDKPESENSQRRIERLLNANYTPDNVSLKGLTGELSSFLGARKNLTSSSKDDMVKLSRVAELGLKAADVFERSVKQVVKIGFDRFEKSVNKFDQVYQQNYASVAAFTGRNQAGYRDLQSQVSSWTRENYRSSLNSAELIEDISKNVSKGFSEDFSVLKAQQDAIIKQTNPAIDTQSAQFTTLQRVLGPSFSQQIAGMLDAVKSTAGSTIALVEQGNKLLDDTKVLAYNSRYDRFAQDNADFMTKLSKAVEDGHMDQSQMNEMVNQLSLMMDPVSGLKSGNLATKMAIANPNTDLSSLESMANALISSQGEVAGWASQGTDRGSLFRNSALGNAAGFNGAMFTHNSKGYDISSYLGLTAGDLDQYGTKAERDVANNKFVTELEQQNNWWQNSMSADVVSKFKEQYPDAYAVLGSTVMPAFKEVIDLLGMIARRSLFNNMLGGSGSSSLTGSNGGSTLLRGAKNIGSKLVGAEGKLFSTSAYQAARLEGAGVLKSANAGLSTAGRVVGGVAGIAAGGLMAYSDYKNYENTYESGGGWKAALMGDNSTGSEWNWGNAGSQAMKYGAAGAGIGTLIGGPIGTVIGGLIGGAAGLAAEGIRTLTASAEEARKEAEYSASSWGQLEKALDAANSGVERTTDPFVKFAQEASQGYSITDPFGEVLTTDGSHRTGLSRVPFDNYRAILHKDESVLTEQATKILRAANPRFWTPQGAQELADNSQIVEAINNQTNILARAYTYDPNSIESQLQAKIARNQLASKNLSVIGAV